MRRSSEWDRAEDIRVSSLLPDDEIDKKACRHVGVGKRGG